MPLIPIPPIPTKCTRRVLPSTCLPVAGCRLPVAGGEFFHPIRNPLRRVRSREPSRGRAHLLPPLAIPRQRYDLIREVRPVEHSLVDHHRGSGLLQYRGVLPLV